MRLPAHSEPTADLPGPDLGIQDERDAAALDRARQAGQGASGSADAAPAAPAAPVPLPPQEDDPDDPMPHEGDAPPAVRAARIQNRDAAVGENPKDWTRFDIKSTMRALRIADEGGTRRLLRKLHLAWHHASAATLHRTLHAAGIDSPILKLIPQIVDTCRVCRTWQRPGNATIPSAEVCTLVNENVEADLLFHGKIIIFHCIYAEPHVGMLR